MKEPVVPDYHLYKYNLPADVVREASLLPVKQDTAGMITTLRTYSADGRETWVDIAKRVVEGAWSIHAWHKATTGKGIEEPEVDRLAAEMFNRMVALEWCPAGRGLQHMGHDRMWIKGAGVLNNCAFISTKHGLAEGLEFLTDMSMLGVGVGFDTEGAYKGFIVATPPLAGEGVCADIEDTREGWVEAMVHVARAFTEQIELFDLYMGGIRKEGAPLRTMGGKASGPKPLIEAILDMVKVLDAGVVASYDSEEQTIKFRRDGSTGDVIKGLSSEIISDVMNLGGRCVVSGGLRRSAELGLFRDGDQFPYKAKLDDEKANSFRWAANNTVKVLDLWEEQDFGRMIDSCCSRGDPGALLEANIYQWGRTGEVCQRERFAEGCNPCGEQNLEHGECCNLAENNVAVCPPERFKEAVICSYMYAKLVSLLPFHREDINAIVRRNRRLGLGVTGYMEAQGYTDEVYDDAYRAVKDFDYMFSGDLGVADSIKLTTVKPSGTVSLVLGVSPGMNCHIAPYYIRRINIEKSSPLVPWLAEAGYSLPDNIYTGNSVVVEVPMKTEGKTKLTAIEQLEHVARLQKVWSDNMVSNTIVFDEHEIPEMAKYLAENQWKFKSLSFLQRQNQFEQPVLEEITRDKYDALIAGLKPLDVNRLQEIASAAGTSVHDADDKFCEGDRCLPSWVDA